MPYICNNCGAIFESPKTIIEQHGFTEPPYEALSGCPECESTEYDEAVVCFRCGDTIPFEESREHGEERYCDCCYDEMFR